MKVSLASALLRRKELQQKVDQLKTLNVKDLFDVRVKRTNVTESVDDIVATVPKLRPEEVTAAYDWHARRLREIDLVIQQANHATIVEVPDTTMDDFKTQTK